MTTTISTPNTAGTSMNTSMKKRIFRATAGATLALSGLTVALPAVGIEAMPAAEAAEHNGNPEWIAINQFATGLPSYEADCGPAAVVMAMLASGYTPDAWDPNNPGAAVQEVRAPVGHNDATIESQLTPQLEAQGVPYNADTTTEGAIQALKEGKTVMMSGMMTDLPYTYATGNPHVPHWVVVTGYNSQTGTFSILDSNDGSIRYDITEADLYHFQDNSLTEQEQMQIIVG